MDVNEFVVSSALNYPMHRGPLLPHATSRDTTRRPHGLLAVIAVLGGASLAGCAGIIQTVLQAVAAGRGEQAWFILWNRPVTFAHVLLALALVASLVVICAALWAAEWLRWRLALRRNRPLSERAASPPAPMQVRVRRDK